jgi:hypothetical protein
VKLLSIDALEPGMLIKLTHWPGAQIPLINGFQTGRKAEAGTKLVVDQVVRRKVHQDPVDAITCIVMEDENSFRTDTLTLQDTTHVCFAEVEDAEAAAFQKALRAHKAEIVGLRKPLLELGSDPEMFVLGKDDKLIPAFELFPAKTPAWEDPKPLIPYWDGFQAEFGMQGYTCLTNLVAGVGMGLDNMLALARKKRADAKLSVVNLLDIPKEKLYEAKPEHVALGCAPSYNVYGVPSLDVADPRELPVRVAGGHIHFGIRKLTKPFMQDASVENVVKMLDAIVGVASVSLFEGMERPERRQFYGRAGEYRLPAHGIEYRTLGPAWLAAPGLTNLIMELSRQAYRLANLQLKACWDAPEQEVQDIINGLNVKAARRLLGRNREVLEGLLRRPFYDKAKTTAEVIVRGCASVYRDPMDVEGNWHLGKLNRVHRTWAGTLRDAALGKQ